MWLIPQITKLREEVSKYYDREEVQKGEPAKLTLEELGVKTKSGQMNLRNELIEESRDRTNKAVNNHDPSTAITDVKSANAIGSSSMGR